MDSYEDGRYKDGGDRGDKDRSYDRSRDGDYSERRRRRSRSRERDYSRRDRSRSRERRRGEEREDRYYSRRYDDDRRDYGNDRRGYYDDRDSYDDRERDRDHRERRRWEERDRRRTDDYHRSEDRIEPGPVVMLRNLRDDTRKEDLSRAIGTSMSYVRDIRLIQRRDGSNGFAFVEFYETQDAVRWMEDNQDNFVVLGSRVNIEYSRHRKLQVEQRETRSHLEDRDWVCFKCDTMNFARRRLCMTCDCPRSESESLHEDVRQGRLSDDHREGDREENNPPSNVLILKGLDALSTETSVRQAVANVCALSVRDIRLIRDKVTNTSRGFCFVEMNNIEDAKELLSKMQDQYPAFFVDGRRVSASYARQNSASSSSKSATTSVASAAIAQAQWSMVAQQKSGQWQQQTEQYSAQVSQQQPVQQRQEYGSTQSGQQSYQQAGANVSTQAQQQYQSTGQTQDAGVTSTSAQSDQQLPSTYSYDSASGFYYDSATGLHYDPKTQYHYNSQTGQYCYYDSAQQAYVAVDSQGNPVASSSSTTVTSTSPSTSVETKKKKDSVATVTAGSAKNAKKIAKDMERWAKNFNAAKASQQQQLQAIIQQERAEAQVKTVTSVPAPVVAAEGFKRTGIALSAALENEDDRSSLSTHTVEVGGADPGPTPLPQGADTNPTHTDWNQLACLLCKRKFPSRDVLIKHQQFSELHKQNLEMERKLKSQVPSEGVGVAGGTDESAQYRDRAKERREKYGSPAIIPGWKRRLERELDKDPPVPYEQPTREGIGQDNIGSKMLQAMGWSDGQGLGKANQGITEPIKAKMRQAGAGLGSRGSSYGVYSSSGSYKETLKNLTKARYDEMFTD